MSTGFRTGSEALSKSYIRYNTQPIRWTAIPTIDLQFQGLYPMVSSAAKEIVILGITQEGRTFRPSDWAERLAGVMSAFRPGGARPGSHLSYSPWCIPTTMGNTKCVVVNRELEACEPMAWHFVLNFARDNQLQVVEACLLPDPPVDR
jgi:Protein of unknown function (DUF3579)